MSERSRTEFTPRLPDMTGEIGLSSGERLSVGLWRETNPECWVASVLDDPGLVAQQDTHEQALEALRSDCDVALMLGLLHRPSTTT